MEIWLHLTGGVIFPLRRNSAVFFWPPRGLPSDGRERRHRGRPRGGCRRPWRVFHEAAGYTGHCVILLPFRRPHLDTNGVYMFNLSLKPDGNEFPVEKWNDGTKKRRRGSNTHVCFTKKTEGRREATQTWSPWRFWFRISPKDQTNAASW